MSPGRRLLVSVFVLAVVVAHVPYLFTGSQHWPVLGYPMFSFAGEDFLVTHSIDPSTSPPRRSVECLVAYGTTKGEPKREVPLGRSTIPLGPIRLRYLLSKALNHPERAWRYPQYLASCRANRPPSEEDACVREQALNGVLDALVTLHNQARSRIPNLPEIESARVYRVRVALDEHLKSTSTSTKTPLYGPWPVVSSTSAVGP